MKNKILWIITARSGSKSIINKNIKELNKLPLIAYKIKTALSISNQNDVWVSTDSKEYASISKEFGATVPFLRPDHLSTDSASSVDVISHCIDHAEKNKLDYDYIGMLEPTSPFVYFSHLQNALELLSDNSKADAIVATREIRPHSFFVQADSQYISEVGIRIKNVKNYGRQNFKKEITPSGGFYISKWDSFKSNNGFYSKNTLSFDLPIECELEIDEPIDWDWAEFLIINKMINFDKLWK